MDVMKHLYCWSSCAFSIRLSLALRFWNHIFTCVSLSDNADANSHLRKCKHIKLEKLKTKVRNAFVKQKLGGTVLSQLKCIAIE